MCDQTSTPNWPGLKIHSRSYLKELRYCVTLAPISSSLSWTMWQQLLWQSWVCFMCVSRRSCRVELKSSSLQRDWVKPVFQTVATDSRINTYNWLLFFVMRACSIFITMTTKSLFLFLMEDCSSWSSAWHEATTARSSSQWRSTQCVWCCSSADKQCHKKVCVCLCVWVCVCVVPSRGWYILVWMSSRFICFNISCCSKHITSLFSVTMVTAQLMTSWRCCSKCSKNRVLILEDPVKVRQWVPCVCVDGDGWWWWYL